MTKPTKWHVRPAKTQISLGIRPVWSESSLSAWRKLGSLATHWAHSKDWSDWAEAQADLSSLGTHLFCWFCHVVAQMFLVLGFNGSWALSLKWAASRENLYSLFATGWSLKTANIETRYEPHHEKTCLRGLRPGKTQTSPLSYRN